MKFDNINVVIVTYNRLALLKECIEAVKSQTYPINKIVIVDNFSSDGTREFLNSISNTDEKFVIELLNYNQGGAGGFSAGIKRALDFECDWIWIMDDDTIPLHDALEMMVNNKYIKKNAEKIGYLSSNVLWSNYEAGLINIPAPEKDFNKFLDYDITKLKHTTFVSFLVRSDVVKQVGLPFKEFFIWGDDVEYSRRIRKYGYENYLINHSKVIHKRTIGQSNDLISEENLNRLWLYKYAARNHTYLAKKEGLISFIKHLIVSVVDIFKIMKFSTKYKFKKLNIHIINTIKGIIFNPKIEKIDSTY